MKFFDSVDLTNLRNVLERLEIPNHLLRNMIGWNRIPPMNVETSTNLTWDSDESKEMSLNLYKNLSNDEKNY